MDPFSIASLGLGYLAHKLQIEKWSRTEEEEEEEE